MAEDTQELRQTIDRVLQAATRRRWGMIWTFCATILCMLLYSYSLPAQYRSDATILVEQQQVPERYVFPTSKADLLQALQAMTQDILSRARLLQIIDEVGLYAAEKKNLGPEELVELMRKNIQIEPLVHNVEKKEANAFRISFVGDKPKTTQEVVNRLTSLFIVQNLKIREEQAKGTTNFLQDQLAVAATNLQQQESRLRDFKMQHLGELPQEQEGNLQVLAGLQMQLQNTLSTLSHARQQEAYLESLLAQYRALARRGLMDAGATSVDKVLLVEKQLADLRTQRAAMRAHYTPQHPDIVNLERQIKETEALLAVIKKSQQDSDAGATADPSAAQATAGEDSTVAQIKSQLKANQLEIAGAAAQQKQLETRVAEYQRRLNLTPVREQQLAELLRNYSTSQKNYEDLENKKTQSALAEHLEKNQQGQQFRIVDPASLPTRPFSPDRQKLSILGIALGILLAAGMAATLEFRDTSFHSEKEISLELALPFVLGVPLLLSPTEEKKRSRRRILEWASGSLLLSAVLIAQLVSFLRG